ncbi:MAG: HAD family phosphatase [Treponemataceae bacterium]|nr:HAD family phosphatase [Treponemataceae bacterium]
MMEKEIAVLFDLDGVVIDTETEYSRFWQMVGRDFLHDDDFAVRVKGQSLKKIFQEDFASLSEKDLAKIIRLMNELAEKMQINFIPGVLDFIAELKSCKIPLAIVTSSDRNKMKSLYKRYPEIESMFDVILTDEDFERGKPEPDPYLKAAEKLGIKAENALVFEDSFNGLESGRSAGMKVIALATSHSVLELKNKADLIIPDFVGFSLEKMLSVF